MADFFESLGFSRRDYFRWFNTQPVLSTFGPRSYIRRAVEPGDAKLRVDVSNVILLSAPPTFTDERMHLIVSALSKPPAFSDLSSAHTVRNSGESYLSALPPSNCAL
jgi:hypothetical protein